MDSIRTNFSELFAAFSSEDSVTILTAFFFTWLIGWLMRYFWDRWKFKALESSIEKSEQEKSHFKSQWEKLKEQHALQEADLKKANLELVEKRTTLESAEAEKRTLSSRLNATLVDLDKSREEFQENSSRMEDLNDQILGLRTKNAQLSTEMEQKATLAGQYSLSSDTTEINQKHEQEVADLVAENSLLKNSIQDLKAEIGAEGTTEATLRISSLEQENEELKNKIALGAATATAATAVAATSAGGESVDTSALENRIAELEAEKDKLEDSLAEITQLEDGNKALSTTVNDLMAENEQLKGQLDELPQYESGNDALNSSVQTLLSENEDLQTSADNLVQYEAGNEVLSATITDLIAKNEALEEQLANNANNQVEWAVTDDVIAETEMEEAEEMDVEEAKTKFRAAIGNQIARATADERDDLKQINGIGPFIEEKLNDLGIYTFEQISQLDGDMTETLTTAIEFFPGRIDRDDWVGQADRLFYTRGNAPQEMNTSSAKITTRRYATATEKIEVNEAEPIKFAASARSISTSKPDDLKKIEGIGPKIAQILNDAGIYTFSNLSQTPTDRLKNILAEAGNRYKMHDPQTWPNQAALAAAGEWEKLKELQDVLDGGRDVSKG